MSRSSSATKQRNFDIPFLFTLPAGLLRQHLPLIDRHLKLLALSTWGYSHETLARASYVYPETMRALLVRIRSRAKPFLDSSAFAGSHKALGPFRWWVSIGADTIPRGSFKSAVWRARHPQVSPQSSESTLAKANRDKS